jgi:hypothetical protein
MIQEIVIYQVLQLLDVSKKSSPPNFEDYRVVCELKNDSTMEHDDPDDTLPPLVHQAGMSLWNPKGLPMRDATWVTFDLHAHAGTNFASLIKKYMAEQGMPGGGVFLGAGPDFMSIPKSTKDVRHVLIIQGDIKSVRDNFHTRALRY